MIARKRVQVFKPAMDDRYSLDESVSHGELRMKAEVVQSAAEILKCLDWRTGGPGDDEANFLGRNWSASPLSSPNSGQAGDCLRARHGLHGRPFAPIPDIAVPGGIDHQDAGYLAYDAALRLSTRQRWWPPTSYCGGRGGHVRGALPALFEAGLLQAEFFDFARPPGPRAKPGA